MLLEMVLKLNRRTIINVYKSHGNQTSNIPINILNKLLPLINYNYSAGFFKSDKSQRK